MSKQSAAKEIVEFERSVKAAEIKEGLAKFSKRTNYTPSTDYTPLDSVIASEEIESDEYEQKKETAIRLLQFLAADGPDPTKVLRRLYAMGAHMGVSPFCDLTLREKKLLLGGSHGAHHWLINKLCVSPLMRAGARSYKSPGQKSMGSRARYSKCQQGNNNRSKNKPHKKSP